MAFFFLARFFLFGFRSTPPIRCLPCLCVDHCRRRSCCCRLFLGNRKRLETRPCIHSIDGTVSLDGIINSSSCLMNSLRLSVPFSLFLFFQIFIYSSLKEDITKLFHFSLPLSRPAVESKSNKFRYGRHKSSHWENPKKANIFFSPSFTCSPLVPPHLRLPGASPCTSTGRNDSLPSSILAT